MLDIQDTQLIEAHLAGCEACRMDVVRQQSIVTRLNNLPVSRMPQELHQRLDESLATLAEGDSERFVPCEIKEKSPRWSSLEWLRRMRMPTAMTFIAASGWGMAMMLSFIMLLPSLTIEEGNDVPMIQDVIAEYRALSRATLPVSLSNISEQAPAVWNGSHLVAQWKTTIAGEPAEAYAVRSGDDIILQFKIAESVFFHNSSVRMAISNIGNYQVKNKDLKVVALPLKKAGLLIIGASKEMPAVNKISVLSI